ncbi:MAG: hypothetical protein ACP5N7_04810 [Candidatus Pacearchaeota archaeon]
MKTVFFATILITFFLTSFDNPQKIILVSLQPFRGDSLFFYEGRQLYEVEINKKKNNFKIPKDAIDFKLLELRLYFSLDKFKNIATNFSSSKDSQNISAIQFLIFHTKEKSKYFIVDTDFDKDFTDEKIITEQELQRGQFSANNAIFYNFKKISFIDSSNSAVIKSNLDFYPRFKHEDHLLSSKNHNDVEIITTQTLKIGTIEDGSEKKYFVVFTHNMGNIFDLSNTELFVTKSMDSITNLSYKEFQKLSSEIRIGSKKYYVKKIAPNGTEIQLAFIN